MMLRELTDMIAAVCPVDGINAEGVIWFRPEATADQKAQATQIMHDNISSVEDAR